MPRPKLDTGDATDKVTVRFARQKIVELNAAADREGCGAAEYIRRAVDSRIGNEAPTSPGLFPPAPEQSTARSTGESVALPAVEVHATSTRTEERPPAVPRKPPAVKQPPPATQSPAPQEPRAVKRPTHRHQTAGNGPLFTCADKQCLWRKGPQGWFVPPSTEKEPNSQTDVPDPDTDPEEEEW